MGFLQARNNLQDEDQLRAFYASCGTSKSTTEAAIKVRRGNKPVASEIEGRKRRSPNGKFYHEVKKIG